MNDVSELARRITPHPCREDETMEMDDADADKDAATVEDLLA